MLYFFMLLGYTLADVVLQLSALTDTGLSTAFLEEAAGHVCGTVSCEETAYPLQSLRTEQGNLSVSLISPPFALFFSSFLRSEAVVFCETV
jgi:hypothetical protein